MDGQNIALIIWTYICPSIIIAGTVGNILSLMAVTNRHCRKSSFTVYLAALAITDTTYLYACVLPDWLTHVFAIRLGSFGNSWCKVTWVLTFLTSQASSWLVAALTAERMLCTYFPHKTKTACVPRTGYIVAGTIIGILFLLNAHLLYAVQDSHKANNNTISLGTAQLAKVYRATSGPTHYSIAARWWLPSTALWRGCNSADDGSDVALTPTDRRRPANGPTYYMFFNKQLNYFIQIFFHVNYSSTVHFRDWVGPC